ncbi:bacitracin ABC transporter ATP-binding protein, partial [Listeria monocytogenes]|nr:bacitracin ABC transporter ATP-binding protein [Listeria monocytogenes]HEL8813396.1 bacitracin ABC transporter ATP-binding protein [Listeria monocytogenes]
METVLKAHKVRKVYGSKGNLFSALGSISLEIQKGSFVGIMGPS